MEAATTQTPPTEKIANHTKASDAKAIAAADAEPQGSAPAAGQRVKVRVTAEEVIARARQGDRTVLPLLEQVLDQNPLLWQKSYQLTSMTEQAWVDRIAGRDLVLSQSIRRHVQHLKIDLAGPNPSPLEKLLVERIAADWLAVQAMEVSEATEEQTGCKVAQMRLKRLDSAHRRYLAATRALAVTRRLTHGLKIEINHTNAPADDRVGSAPSSRDPETVADKCVRQRLRSLFSEDSSVAPISHEEVI